MFFQLSLWLGFALVYQLARGIADRSTFEAIQNGILVIDAERAMHALVELDIQRTILHGGNLALEAVNWTYWLSQFAVLGIALLWIYLFRNDAFTTVRNWIFATNLLALVGYVLMPTA
ncbi:MAG: phosphatase PAP2 family protein, partial [Gaiellaceae bacterium]